MVNLRKMLAVSILSILPYYDIKSNAPSYLNAQPVIGQLATIYTLVEEDDFIKKFGKEKLHYSINHKYFKGSLDMEFQKADEPKFDYKINADLHIEEYKFVYYLIKPFISLSGTPANIDRIFIESNIILREGKLATLERTQSYFNEGKLKKESKRIYDYGRRTITKEKKIGNNVSVEHYNMDGAVDYYEDIFSLIYNIRAGSLGKLKAGESYKAYTHSKGETLKLNFFVKSADNGLLNVSSDLNQKSNEFDFEECILVDNQKRNYPMKKLKIDFHGSLELKLID